LAAKCGDAAGQTDACTGDDQNVFARVRSEQASQSEQSGFHGRKSRGRRARRPAVVGDPPRANLIECRIAVACLLA
jgi:hypothetical protein